MAPSRKSKKQRTQEAPPTVAPLGALLSATLTKDESELELEEAVFGRSRGGKGSVWDAEVLPRGRFDVEDDEDLEIETGLERLKDENVSPPLLRFSTSTCAAALNHLVERSQASAQRPRDTLRSDPD